ncbi:MAG: hypothetical protein JRI45_03920 [Deltaproteobacteria bacterium]|nr:hypothetical protein [Deltaproteobacteria bacterium]MBW2067945.1 hypothetical protein [Deltaproteobacteria bacterium]
MRCPRCKDIYLSVLDELDAGAEEELKTHLESCDECKKEYSEVQGLVNYLRVKTLPDIIPAHGPQKAIKRDGGFFVRFFGVLKPAVAMIILVLLFAVGLQLFHQPSLSPEEKEVVENMEFLKDLDVLEKLVQIVDGTPGEHSSICRKHFRMAWGDEIYSEFLS